MKTSLLPQLLSALTILATPQLLVSAVPSPDRHISEFEARYINTLDYQLPNNTIKLIGYKKIHIPADQRAEFENHYANNHAEWAAIPNYFYDKAGAALKVYFPVAEALIEHNGKLVEANHLGEMPLNSDDASSTTTDCHVLGRKQTDSVTGVEGNIIRDGIIYLSPQPHPNANTAPYASTTSAPNTCTTTLPTRTQNAA